MLQGVVQRGTGRRVKAVNKPLAGKTGTTNESFDTWFVGFSPDLVVGVFVGFDEPRTLGRETGSSVAAPIFRDFMTEALEDKPAIPFRVPPGIRLVRVNTVTGLPAAHGDKNVILEAFRPGTEPTGRGPVVDGKSLLPAWSVPAAAPGGLY
jgi:penicillin-binding protein 1A